MSSKFHDRVKDAIAKHYLEHEGMPTELHIAPEQYTMLRGLCFTEEMFTLIGWQANGGLTYLGLKVIESCDVTELEVK